MLELDKADLIFCSGSGLSTETSSIEPRRSNIKTSLCICMKIWENPVGKPHQDLYEAESENNHLYMVPVIPPLTEINWAVIHRLFSDTSRSVASAISSTVPRRFAARVCSDIEIWSAVADPSDATRSRVDKSVGTGPGAMVLTVIPDVLPSCPPFH